jgi:hypothetical protein
MTTETKALIIGGGAAAASRWFFHYAWKESIIIGAIAIAAVVLFEEL